MKPDRRVLKNKENSISLDEAAKHKIDLKDFEASAKSRKREEQVGAFIEKECNLTEVEKAISEKYFPGETAAFLKARKACLEVTKKEDYDFFKKELKQRYKIIKKVVDKHQAERIKREAINV